MSWGLIDRLGGKLKNLIGKGTTNLVDCSGDIRRVQGTYTSAEDTHDGMPAPEQYGVCSYPPPGLPNITLFPAGDRSAGIVITVVDNRYRPTLALGDSVLYDLRGQGLHFHPGGARLVVKGKLEIWADDIEEHAAVSRLVSVGGYAEKLTHVSEGQLIAETWHTPAVVTSQPDHGYKLPEEVPDV